MSLLFGFINFGVSIQLEHLLQLNWFSISWLKCFNKIPIRHWSLSKKSLTSWYWLRARFKRGWTLVVSYEDSSLILEKVPFSFSWIYPSRSNLSAIFLIPYLFASIFEISILFKSTSSGVFGISFSTVLLIGCSGILLVIKLSLILSSSGKEIKTQSAFSSFLPALPICC